MKALIPQTTTPLTKFIRTLEGWIVVLVNGTLIIVPIVTSALPATTAVKYGTIFNGIMIASRSILKGIASLSPLIGSPVTPSGLDAIEEDVSGAPAPDLMGTPPDAATITSAGAPDQAAPGA